MTKADKSTTMPHTPPIERGFYRRGFDLTGKVAIVTGGAGHIGSAISCALADCGATVVVTGRTEEKLKTFVERANREYDGRVSYAVNDVSDSQGFKDLVDRLHAEHGRLDILVNNAFNEKRKAPEEMTPDEFLEGLRGVGVPVFSCSMAVLPYMRQQGSGSVINVASLYSFIAPDQTLFNQENPSSSPFYAFAKGGVLSMTRWLASRYASEGVRFNCISPGHIPKPQSEPSEERLKYLENLASRPPMKRIGFAEDIGCAAVFLAADGSSYKTGGNLVIDGGWSII